MVIPGHNLGNSQVTEVSVNRTIGPTLVFVCDHFLFFVCINDA